MLKVDEYVELANESIFIIERKMIVLVLNYIKQSIYNQIYLQQKKIKKTI